MNRSNSLAIKFEAPSFADRCAAWNADHDKLDASYVTADQQLAALGKRPTAPKILRQPLRCNVVEGGTEGEYRKPPKAGQFDAAPIWTAKRLSAVLEDGGFVSAKCDIINRTAVITTYVAPLADGETEKAKNMLAAAQKFEKALDDYMARVDAIEKPSADLSKQVSSEGVALIAEPVDTLADLAEQARIIKRLDLITGGELDGSDEAIMAMLDNIERLGK